MIIKRKGTHVDRMLVLNAEREVSDFLCGVHTFDHTGYKETVHWTGPDRVMRDMMAFHNLVAANPEVQTTLEAWQ